MKHRHIYMFYMVILLSAISWRVTRASSSFSEINNVEIDESGENTFVTIKLTKPAKAIPQMKNNDNCFVLDFEQTVLSEKLPQKAFAGKNIKLAYFSSVKPEEKINAGKKKSPANKCVRAKFFIDENCLPSVKFKDKSVLLKLSSKGKGRNPEIPSNSLLHPKESKYSPVVLSLEDAPFLPIVTELAIQAGMDLKFKGNIPETLSVELQSEDAFDALCTIAMKNNLRFFREGKIWYMDGDV